VNDSSQAGPICVAVGIPQGVLLDKANGEAAGAVRLGGVTVSLELVDYGLWTMLLTPMTLDAAVRLASDQDQRTIEDSAGRLERLGLLTWIDGESNISDDLARLRPIPLGCTVGNTGLDSDKFDVQNSSLTIPSPLSLDAISFMFWCEFDGQQSLQDVIATVTSKVGELPHERARSWAVDLVWVLMVRRLLYLDRLAN
jgi:hypothetical protein